MLQQVTERQDDGAVERVWYTETALKQQTNSKQQQQAETNEMLT